MSYFNTIKIDGYTSDHQMAMDAFGRARVSEPKTLFDSKLVAYDNTLFWNDIEVSGSGTTSAHQVTKSAQKLSVSGTTAGSRVRQSKIRGNYQPGKSQLILLTALVGAGATGITKRWGNFDTRNGLFFELDETTFGVGVRTYTSGSPADTVVTQANFNVDKLNGTGTSGYTLDLSKSTIFFIDFEWLAVGQVRFGVVDKGRFIVAHIVTNSQTLTSSNIVYMTIPNLPIRYEITNDGSGAASDLYAICSTIASEGGQDNTAISSYISRNGVPITLANQDLYTPVLSIRLKSSTNTGTAADREGFCTRATIQSVDVLLTSATNYEWRLYLNPTIAGSDAVSWVNLSNSALQYDVSRTNANTVSGGHIIGGGYGASSNQVKNALSQGLDSYLTMGSNVDFTTDQLVLAVANIDADGGTAYGAITVNEYA